MDPATKGRRFARTGWAALALLLISTLGWGVRLLDAPAVFTEEGVRAAGPDAYYHLRRVAYSYDHFPSVLEHDPYLNHPLGGDVIWPPGLDWGVAAAARLLLGSDAPPERLQRFALHVPVFLGVLAIVGTFAFAAWRTGLATASVAAILLALLPAHAFYSRVGMLDHHAAEPLVTLGFLFATTVLVDRALRHGFAQVGFSAAGLGAVIAVSFLVWPGSLLQVGWVDALLLWWLCTGGPGPTLRGLAAGAAIAHGLAAFALLPFADREYAHWGSFAPVVLSRFHPWLLSCAALSFGFFAFAAERGRAARASGGVLLGSTLLAASALVWPEVAAAPEQIFGWFARDEAFQSQVAESLPLFSEAPRGRWHLGRRLLSGAIVVFPVVLCIRAIALRRRFDAGGVVLLTLAAGLGIAAVAQRRFANAFSVPYVLLLAWFLASWLPQQLRERVPARPARFAAAAAVTVLVGAALVPCLDAFAPALNRRAQVRAGEPLRLAVDQWRRHELHRLAGWIRENTPETAGFDAPADPASRPEYGVLSHWSNGHILASVARRPAVVTNFGDDLGPENMATVERYFRAAEPEASRLLDALGARYAVLEFRKQVPFQEFPAGSMISRAFFADGEAASEALERQAGTESSVPGDYAAFERHRLIHESAAKPWAPDQPFFKLYEHVAGARLEGRAPANAPVTVTLGLETSAGRRFQWRQTTRAGPDGGYRLRVPYATHAARTAIRADPGYRVSSGSAEVTVAVDERDVQGGQVVRVAPLPGRAREPDRRTP